MWSRTKEKERGNNGREKEGEKRERGEIWESVVEGAIGYGVYTLIETGVRWMYRRRKNGRAYEEFAERWGEKVEWGLGETETERSWESTSE